MRVRYTASDWGIVALQRNLKSASASADSLGFQGVVVGNRYGTVMRAFTQYNSKPGQIVISVNGVRNSTNNKFEVMGEPGAGAVS